MPPSASRTARAIAREQLSAAIVASAREQLGVVGPVGLSVRAVARDLNMASSALYRYVASRDDLLTLLIVQIYDELGAVAETCEAESADADLATRWLTLCHALRAWAVAHPHDYALLYGTPVPGYAAPAATIPAAIRVTSVFVRLLAAVPEDSPAGRPLERPDLVESIAGLTAFAPGTTREPVLVRGLLAWSAVFGTLSFELFGHLEGAVTDYSRYADMAFAQLGADFGLTVATT